MDLTIPCQGQAARRVSKVTTSKTFKILDWIEKGILLSKPYRYAQHSNYMKSSGSRLT